MPDLNSAGRWPRAEVVQTWRLIVQPVLTTDADEMVHLLSDRRLYEYIGGGPPAADELRRRFGQQALGVSPAGDEGWLSWTLKLRTNAQSIGFVQATLPGAPDRVAQLAWLVGTGHQGLGYAVEAASAVAEWLGERGWPRRQALIAEGHVASEAVARRLGMEPTTSRHDGEVLWRS